MKMKLMICQLEKGEEGTPHLQGYVEVKSPSRLAAMKKLLPRAHLEVSRGSPKEAMEYCLKEEHGNGDPMRYWLIDGQLETFAEDWPDSLTNYVNALGERMNTSKSSTKLRLQQIRSKLLEGNSEVIEEIADEEFDLWVRYYRAFERYLVMKTKPRNHVVDVYVLQGPTGTGKSKWAMEQFPNAYWKQRSNWWDGYCGQEVVVIDEFYGWLPFDLLLRVCDRYPLLVESKGGQIQFTAKKIVITTNQLPCNWYKSGTYFPSFVRRVTEWHTLPIWGDHRIYLTYPEFIANAVENIMIP